ncbi:sulfotransferase family protein [Terracoccus luteus]|uniref:Sulfotransferase domain-containing protein n=1 Tax=Terracoccus luteus TaxID=53356 RepID=A0A839PY38_9MICO|nr:sulfotransferase [Terracoccus luteus]MBB2985702.1 hypothetical protein [Terracoccus luteus]MCP2171354.1 hypothetical protein [Terracoccus luteus]
MTPLAPPSRRRAAWLKGEQRLRETVRSARASVRARRHGPGSMPDFLVIGGMRCGTTSLYSYLAQHPDVEPAIGKELQYFTVFHDRGERWYRGHFPPATPGRQTFEASPYYLYHPLAPQRIAAAMPEGRFVALLRDPAARAVSHYRHSVERGVEPLSFADALAAEDERLAPYLGHDVTSREAHAALRSFSYASRGLYADQLERWFEHVPREQVLVLKSEEMYADPAPVYDRVLDFLGLAPHTPDRFGVFSRPKPRIDAPADSTLAELERRFAPHNDRLANLLGWSGSWPAELSTPTTTSNPG